MSDDKLVIICLTVVAVTALLCFTSCDIQTTKQRTLERGIAASNKVSKAEIKLEQIKRIVNEE